MGGAPRGGGEADSTLGPKNDGVVYCRSTLAIFCLSLILQACGCVATRPAEPPPLRSPARRIVSLAPNTTEILFALGAGAQVVACTNACTWPLEVKGLPRVGDVHIDLERVVAVAPDLVVAEWVTPPELVARLRALNLRVVQTDSSTLQGYLATLRVLGGATGHGGEAARLRASLETRLAQMRERLRHLPPRQRARVFVEIWSRPLQTAAAGTFIDEMVTLAGGVNVFSEQEQYPQVSPEALVIRDPDVVLLTSVTLQEFASRPAFQSLRALRAGRVFTIDPDTLTRPGPRLGQALDVLSKDLTP